MPLRISVVRLCGAGLLGLMLAAPLVLLFLQYESLSINVHKPEFDTGSQADPAWGVLHWIVPWFPDAPEPPAGPRNWFGVAVAISALAAVSGRNETKRLHAWLFLVLGVLLLVKIYDFRVLEWVGHLPAAKLVVFPTFAAPVVSFAFAVLAGIGVQVLWSRDLRFRRFLILLAAALTVLITVLSAGGRLFAIVARAPDGLGSRSFLRHLGRRCSRARLLARPTMGAVAPRRSRRLGAVRARATRYLREESRPVRDSRVDGPRPRAQSAEPYSRVFATDGKLYPNTAGALGLQDIRALDGLYVERYCRYVRRSFSRRFRPIHGGRARVRPLQGNPMFDALGVRVSSRERTWRRTRAQSRSRRRYARLREHQRLSTVLGRARRPRRSERRRRIRLSPAREPTLGWRVIVDDSIRGARLS